MKITHVKICHVHGAGTHLRCINNKLANKFRNTFYLYTVFPRINAALRIVAALE